MRSRLLGALVVAVVAVVALAGVTAAAQSSTSANNNVPRTADGRPDLSGVWSHNAATPLQRPTELAGRAFLTEAEVARLKSNAAKLFNGETDAAFGDSVFLAALRESGDFKSSDTQTGNYNHFWLVDREFDNRTSLIVDPPDGRQPAQTPEAQARNAEANAYRNAHYADGPEDVPHNCWGGNVPSLGAGYNNYYQIFQGQDSVAVYMEMMHDSRLVPLDSRERPSNVGQRLGSSRGHWEGDTLVIETAGFRAAGQPGVRTLATANPSRTIIEKFTRLSQSTLKYEVTTIDPATLTAPWTAVLYWKNEPKDQLFEFACHEGNEAMAGTLSGYRYYDKVAAEAARKGSN